MMMAPCAVWCAIYQQPLEATASAAKATGERANGGDDGAFETEIVALWTLVGTAQEMHCAKRPGLPP